MLKQHRIYNARFELYERKKDSNTYGWEGYTHSGTIEIDNKITCMMNITIDSSGSANMGVFQFLNLSPQVRTNLWVDQFNQGIVRIMLTFQAGYGYPDAGNDKFVMPMIFFGEVKQCTSQKDGKSTNWVTEVQAMEGGMLYEYGYCNSTISKGTNFTDALNHLAGSGFDVKLGYITPDIPPLPRNKTFIGQTMDLLGREYGGYEVFIDRGKLNILGPNDVIPGEILTITDASGLLGSPKRSSTLVIVDTLFEPQVRVGQEIAVLSHSLPQLNQAYKVMSVRHSGTISERESGSLITSLTLWNLDTEKKKELKEAEPTKYTGQADSVWSKPLPMCKVTSNFGWRIHPITKQRQFHSGIDLAASMGEGSPIYAPANGKVTFVGQKGGYGNCIMLDNGKIDNINVSSLYGHLKSWTVKHGQQVYKGNVIGYEGSTGMATAAHLHFEVRENGNVVNPSKYIGNL